MQLRRMTRVLVVLGAMGLALTACKGGIDLSCSVDKDCLESELCHPDDKVCMQLCRSTDDCPESADTCEALTDTNASRVCKCKNPEGCRGGTSP
ncbi:hypothetical protein JQX13_19020 [Archangium violaceum]|uniref:hypothetical protein n=1 Tax=Archangium violaceum TaxID=83451 RepID=UPI00193AF5EA|nr:hypothetical protein [Archangium violaceum]QRK11960.1 hypothetical protein JQX13_19020 [Archangium violaceum]